MMQISVISEDEAFDETWYKYFGRVFDFIATSIK